MVTDFADEAGADAAEREEMADALSLLAHSRWGDPLRIEAKDSGVHSFNLFWDGDAVGSVTATKGEPLRFFVEPASSEGLREALDDAVLDYVETVGTSHYGEGRVRVHLRDLLALDRERQMEILKAINRAVVA